MAIRISLAGGALCVAGACLGAAGCVTEPGQKGPALWSTVDTKSGESDVHLKNPVRLHTSYGRMAEANGRRNVARKHYETALSHDPKCVDALVGVARLDHAAGQTQRAEQGFQKALQVAPKNADALQSAGLFYSSQGRWREAVARLNAAVAAAPNVARHRYALAVVLAKSGDLNAAMPHFTATVGRAEAHSQMAGILLERGDYSRAEQQVRTALSVQPDLESARRLLAQLHGDEPRRNVAGVDPTSPRRSPIRSVSHVGPASGLGSQSAWRREAPQPDGRHPYVHQQHDNGRELRIVPGTSRLQHDGPTIQPARDGRDDRVRSPAAVNAGGGRDTSRGPVPQWNHQGRNE